MIAGFLQVPRDLVLLTSSVGPPRRPGIGDGSQRHTDNVDEQGGTALVWQLPFQHVSFACYSSAWERSSRADQAHGYCFLGSLLCWPFSLPVGVKVGGSGFSLIVSLAISPLKRNGTS